MNPISLTKASYILCPPAKVGNPLPYKGSEHKKMTSNRTQHSGPCLRYLGCSAWKEECSQVLARGGARVYWVYTTDFCPLAPLQHRAPPPRTPCSRPTPECSSMQVVSICASPRLFPWLCSSLHALGTVPPVHPSPGPSTAWGGERERQQPRGKERRRCCQRRSRLLHTPIPAWAVSHVQVP